MWDTVARGGVMSGIYNSPIREIRAPQALLLYAMLIPKYLWFTFIIASLAMYTPAAISSSGNRARVTILLSPFR